MQQQRRQGHSRHPDALKRSHVHGPVRMWVAGRRRLVWLHVDVCVEFGACVHACACLCVCVHACACVYVCVFVFFHVCMRV